MADIAPRAAIEQALAATKGLVRKHGKVQLETALEDDLPIVHVDADRLMQVIVNLISNAVKFSDKEKGWMRLEARPEDGALRVDVRDNGIGIDRKDHNKIFECFQQAGDTLTEKPAGTGLGLPISREILRHFSGEIWVESEPGKGATFRSVFPRQARARRSLRRQTPPYARRPSDRGGRRVRLQTICDT
jgi:signal transduction histidine kinase